MTVWGGADYRGRRKKLPRGVAWVTFLCDLPCYVRGLLGGVASQAGGET